MSVAAIERLAHNKGRIVNANDHKGLTMAVLVHSALCDAMESAIVQVESGFMRGFAGLQLIGHTSEVCRNGVERAKAALEGAGIHLPQKKIVVSLAPAEIKKDGSQFDLAIAVSL